MTYRGALTAEDASFRIWNASDRTKTVKFDLASITTGTERTITVPDASITLARTDAGQTFNGVQTIAKNNSANALELTTPNPGTAGYDSAPIAALHIAATSATRNFESGAWIETNGSAVDKGRGILVDNWGASDGIYVGCHGVNGTGYAGYADSSATGATVAVFSTDKAGQIALALRQETILNASAGGVLLSMQADGAVTEMAEIGSTVNSQVGFIFRMTGTSALPIVIHDPSDVLAFALDNLGTITSNSVNDSFIKGILKNGSTSQAANNAQTVTVGNVGPGSAGVSIQSWWVHKDKDGNTRYIPLFG